MESQDNQKGSTMDLKARYEELRTATQLMGERHDRTESLVRRLTILSRADATTRTELFGALQKADRKAWHQYNAHMRLSSARDSAWSAMHDAWGRGEIEL